MKGTLYLVPLPLYDQDPIDEKTKGILSKGFENKDLILVEEAKPCRRRWIHYGLPREAINEFEIYNEHNQNESITDIIAELKKGRNAFLMSDCGLPAFCDPGSNLVKKCHEQNIKVSATPFSNSIALAMALSGFNHQCFVFEGFLPSKSPGRNQEIKRVLKENRASVVMDTPYRLHKLLQEFKEAGCKRKCFLAMNLNEDDEQLLIGSIENLLKMTEGLKKKFILIIGSNNE